MTSYESLTDKHKKFVDCFLDCSNYTKAYKEAYACTNYNTAKTNGYQLAKLPEVRAAILEKLKEYSADKAETLHKIIQIIDFDLSNYIGSNLKVDIERLNADGYGWMIAGIKQLKFGTEIVLMSKDQALLSLSKIHQLFNDSATVNVNINQEVSAKQQIEDKLKALDEKLNKFDGDGK